jgi:hypothetical protein
MARKYIFLFVILSLIFISGVSFATTCIAIINPSSDYPPSPNNHCYDINQPKLYDNVNSLMLSETTPNDKRTIYPIIFGNIKVGENIKLNVESPSTIFSDLYLKNPDGSETPLTGIKKINDGNTFMLYNITNTPLNAKNNGVYYIFTRIKNNIYGLDQNYSIPFSINR